LINNALLIVDNPLIDRGTIINNARPGAYASYMYNPFVPVTPGLVGSVQVDAGGSLINQGVLGGTASGDGVVLSGGQLKNVGGASIEGNSYGVMIDGSGDFRNAGAISDPGGFPLYAIAPVGIVTTILPGDVVSGYGVINTIASGAENDGTIRASGGTLEIKPAITGTGDLEIAANSTLRIDSATSETILFDRSGTNETLMAAPGNASGAIEGFVAGDTIALGVVGGSIDVQDSPDDTLVTIFDAGGGTVGQLDLVGDYPISHLFFDDTGHLTTDEPVPCYCAGTLIRRPRGQTKVEKLKIGDKIMTMSGVARPIKWIGRRSYSGRFVIGRKDILPVCFKPGSLDDNIPKRDLWISPHHAMYLEGVLIEAKDLVNGVSIVQAEHVEKVEYFHIELNSHDVIIAEGALSETFIDDDSRGMFHNADEYSTTYPGARSVPARYCVPRLADGYEVETARRRIEARAGLRAANDIGGFPLRGYIDVLSTRHISGWAQNLDHPEAPVCLGIFADGRLIGEVLANTYREDLAQAALGSGRHGFDFVPSEKLDFALNTNTIEVRRLLDGARLQRSTQVKPDSRPAKPVRIAVF
jgi:hypothetical protein